MPTIAEQPTRPGTRTQVKLETGPNAPAAARRHVRQTLTGHPSRPAPSLIDDVETLASELTTNGFRYGTEPGDSLLVDLLVSAELVRVEVHDTVRRHPQYRPESDERGRGRGLFILDALATRWGVYDRPFGKVVWAEVAR